MYLIQFPVLRKQKAFTLGDNNKIQITVVEQSLLYSLSLHSPTISFSISPCYLTLVAAERLMLYDMCNSVPCCYSPFSGF